MPPLKNLLGMKFGRLTVIGKANPHYTRGGNRLVKWTCQCDCGNVCDVLSENLLGGITKSCGCLNKEIVSKNNKTHGLSHHKLYAIHSEMNHRCFNPNNKNFKHYGSRGISVCEQWTGRDGFLNFYEWANSHGYKDGLSIERKDVDGDYSPDNCSWIPKNEQPLNRRSNVILSYKGKKQSISEWCRMYRISRKTIIRYLKKFEGDSDATFDFILSSEEHKKAIRRADKHVSN